MRVKQMFQKAASVAVGTAMALNMIAVPIGAKAEELPRPVVHFDFESDLAGDYVEGEGAVARRVNSPVIEQQAINGIVTHVARFDRGGEGYLQLFDTSDGETFSALDGKESFTITFWENAYDGTTSWPFFAMQNGSQAKDRKYVGVISRANYTRLEKQNGRNSGVDIRTVPDGWHHVAYVVNEAGGSVYVNGELAGTLNNGFALPDVIQSNPIVYLGYAAWNEFSNLAMDEFKIYDGELTEAQMKAEYENGIKGEKAPTISSSDDQIAVAEGAVLRVKAGTTASELKRVLTPDPEDAVITIYKDSTKGEEVDGGEAVTQTNVVEISKDNIAILYSIQYILEKTETAATETADQKTFLLGAGSMLQLAESTKNSGTEYQQDTVYGNDAVHIGSWGGQSTLYLPKSSLENLLAVNATVRLESYTKGDARIGLRFQTQEETVAPEQTPYYSVLDDEGQYHTYELYKKENETGLTPADFQEAWLLWYGTFNNGGRLESTYSGSYIKDITLVYEKSAVDKALDAAIQEASERPDQNEQLQSVLRDAKQLKASTADDPMTVIRATQEDIQQATEALRDAMSGTVKSAVITAIDSSVGTESGQAVTVEYRTTAEQLKAAITTDPDNAAVNIYTDLSREAEVEPEAQVSNENIIVVSAMGRNESVYTIQVKPRPENTTIKTTASEDGNKKTIVFAGKDIVNYFGNPSDHVEEDDLFYIDSVATLGGWGSQEKLYLPQDNLKNLISAEVTVRWAAGGNTKGDGLMGLRFTTDGEEVITPSQTPYYSIVNNGLEYHTYSMYDREKETELTPEDFKGAYLLWYGTFNNGGRLETTYTNCYIKEIRLVYEKSEADLALDAAITKAEGAAGSNEVLKDVLDYAKTLKISTAADALTVVTATEAQIRKAADTLEKLTAAPIEKGNLTMDGDLNVSDVQQALKIAGNGLSADDIAIIIGDMNGDKKLTAVDALLILQKVTH